MKTKRYKLKEVLAWRDRQKLGSLIIELAEDVNGMEHTLDRREFDAGNFPFCLREAEKNIKKIRKFYTKHN